MWWPAISEIDSSVSSIKEKIIIIIKEKIIASQGYSS